MSDPVERSAAQGKPDALGGLLAAAAGEPRASRPDDVTVDAGGPGQVLPAANAPRIDGYQVVDRLGEGGMGVVWRAVQLATRREVALKLLGAAGFGSDRARLRFEREVELTAKLDHPHIARIYDSGLRQGVFFYAMELFVGGAPLDAYVAAQQLTRPQIVDLVQTICRAVQHAHQKGVIHRDLKPANILITPDGQPHVLDFGLAKALESTAAQQLSLDGDVAGTPVYMSPEQAGGHVERLDTRTDVYTLAVILFHLLSGSFPHDVSGTALQVMKRVSEDEPRRLSAIHPRADRELEAILAKALDRDPDRRYATAGDLADDLGRYLAHEPLIARPPTLSYLLTKKLRRHRAAAAITAAVLMLLVLVAVLAYVRVSHERNVAVTANTEKDRQRREAEKQRTIADAQRVEADRQRVAADTRLAESLLAQADAIYAAGGHQEARAKYDEARERLAALGLNTLRATYGSFDAYAQSPVKVCAYDDSLVQAQFCPDGVHFVARGNNKFQLRRAATGELVRSAAPPASGLYDLGVAADGRTAAGLYADKQTIGIWDVGSGRVTRSFKAPDAQRYVHLSADGRVAMTVDASFTTTTFWDVTNGAQAARRVIGGARAIWWAALAPDGLTFAIMLTGERGVQLRDVATGQIVRSLGLMSGASGTMAFSPDGRHLAIGTNNGTVHVSLTATGTPLWELRGHRGHLTSLAFSADGQRLATAATDGVARLWDMSTGRMARVVSGNAASFDVSLSPDGKMLLCAGRDGRGGRLWWVDAAPASRAWNGAGRATALSVSRDGRMALATHALSGTCVWDLATGKPLARMAPGEWVGDAELSNLSTAILCGAQGRLGFSRWDPASDAPPTAIAPDVFKDASVKACALSPDGQTLIAAGKGVAWLIDTRAWTVRASGPTPVKADPSCVRYAPDGRHVLLAASQQCVVLDTAASEPLQTGIALVDVGATSVGDFVPPGGNTIFSGGTGGRLAIWDPASGAQTARFESEAGQVNTVAMSPDGSVAATGHVGGTLKLWDLAGRRAVREFSLLDVAVVKSAWSADGSMLVAAGGGGALRVLDLRHAERARALGKSLDGGGGGAAAAATLNLRGEWLALHHMWTPAVDCLRRARDAGADVSRVTLARCEWLTGDLDAAERAFAEALDRREAPEHYLRLCLRGLRLPQREAQQLARTLRELDAAVATAGKGDTKPLSDRIDFLARAERWDDVRADVERLKALQSDETPYLKLCPLLAFTGDVESYRRTAEEMRRRFTGPKASSMALERAAKVLVLLPDTPAETVGVAQGLIDRSLAVAGGDADRFHWGHLTKGLVEYRAGRYESAIAWLDKAGRGQLGTSGDISVVLLNAMANQKLGRTEQAASLWRAAELRGESLGAKPVPSTGLENWWIWQLLRAEAGELMLGGAGRKAKPATRPVTSQPANRANEQ